MVQTGIPVEFRVLGPLAVVEDGRAIPLDRQRLRALLAFLLLHANEAISSDRLIDEVWGPEPPKTAGASLQNYISRLRKAIGLEALVSQPPGYVLRVDPERFDLARFERLTAEARHGSPAERAEKLRAALALWRGPALEDLAFEPFARDEVGRLEEARLAALEERIDAELELGTGGELVGELEELVDSHPLRERFRGQLMRALYRAGRQADALEAYQDARRVLREELGLEPSEELRQLQQAILRQDDALGARQDGTDERAPDRRTVTVLFCDLVDSSRLAAGLDPEVYRQVLSRYFDLVRGPIERHGGTVEKFIGDAVMAVFGFPDLHEDDALRAVRAAAEAQEALRSEDWDVQLAARIGVSTGEVHVLSKPGEDLHLSGAAGSIASRLEKRAPAGGILLSAETHQLARDAVRAEPVDEAWRVQEVLPAAPAYARRLDAALVGRGDELDRLRATYARARDEKHCHVVTVVGEAGIGKTRLARELLSVVHDEAEVLVGRCASYGEGATYLPVAEIVRAAAEEESLAGVHALLEGEEDADAVAQRVAELTGIAEAPAAPGEALWAVRRLLESMARERPLVVVFDDIHWAEPTLLDLIQYLGEWAEGPILVVCLARRELLEARPGWGGPTSTGFLVELDPLPAEALGKLVERLAVEPIAPEVRERIVEHAGGNPLFAEQLVAVAAEAPALAADKPPATLEALLASRLHRLDSRELQVLRRAAVVGRRFTRAELDDLAAGEDPARELAGLTERGFLHPAQGLFRFHHVLVRDVAYRGIPKGERAELHELAARGLDRRDGADELVGYHFEQAYRYLTELARPDDHARELAQEGGERLGRAGIRAWRRADAPAAVNLLSRATTLLSESAAKRELLAELGVALRMRGELDRAQDVLRSAVDSAVAASDRRLELRAKLESIFVESLVDPEKTPELVPLASAAIPVFESYRDHRALGRAWMLLGHVRGAFACELEACAEASARAARHYREAGWSAATCLGNLAAALHDGPLPVAVAIAQCEELLAEHADDRASQANVLLWLGGLEGMRGRFEIGQTSVARAKVIFEELGGVVTLGGCGGVEAAIELLADRIDAAEEALRMSCGIYERLQEHALLSTRAAQLSDVLYLKAQFDESEHWMRLSQTYAAALDIDAQSSWRTVAAKLYARNGDSKRAALLSREARALTEQTDALNHRAKILVDTHEVHALAGRADQSLVAAREALRLYELKGNLVSAERTRVLLFSAEAE